LRRQRTIIAAEKPWWEPGTRIGYHAVTWGYIIGEIVRRVSGKAISQALREEMAGPLGVADELFFAIPRPSRAGWPGWRRPPWGRPPSAKRWARRRPRTRRCSRSGRRSAPPRRTATAPTCAAPTSRPAAR
ncbi:MAG: beta-lactamase family protein, partial [Chloroflexales bacterium]|nr:beta-lactamase family protein [Chloroflexales bacterium]